MPQSNANNLERSKDVYLVPPVRIALVHLCKPIDLSAVSQIAIATGHLKVDRVGSTLPFSHQKVASKVASWNIEDTMSGLDGGDYYKSVQELKKGNPNSRLIGTIVDGGENPFDFAWKPDDILVIGGANGLSAHDIEMMDTNVTIPTKPELSFLTVAVVVSALTYHILTQRNLWDSFQANTQ